MSPSSLLSLRRAVSLLSYLPKPPLPATASTSAGVRSLSSTPEKPQNDSAALKQSSQPSDDSVNPMAKDHISSMEYERSKKGSNDSTGMRKADRPEILLAGDEEFKYRKGKHASVPSNQPDILLAGDEEFKFRGKHSHHQHHHHHHHKMGAETKDAGNGKGNERT